MTKYKVWVLAYGETDYCTNGLEFDTREEATDYGNDLASRWTMVDKWEVR